MLCPVVLPSSLTEEDWLHTAADFENQCNFPHCIGATDGKHIIIQVCILIILLFIYRHLSFYLMYSALKSAHVGVLFYLQILVSEINQSNR